MTATDRAFYWTIAVGWAALCALVVFGIVWFFLVIRPEQLAAEACQAEHGTYVRTYDGWACDRRVVTP